ncbi:hypothetical protein FHS77_003138 [Paenochrobactrum gallinarii]|uniref:Uncharacterized protein n=1 Tax=Paenochrobactrum gallinarii TaxID=643673 RepID=A0A841M0J4_9HYPH|nr:hypothetical protein [Paenochrobactrum gallinarii]MBB6262560.1 hypothetical protein [Paenochrobactrum gallinarii]
MTTCDHHLHAGSSRQRHSLPYTDIDTDTLYNELRASIAAKQTAIGIWCNQTFKARTGDAEYAIWLEQFTLITNRYDLDLIQEALTVIIAHSSMIDYCNIPTQLPVTKTALKIIETHPNPDFEIITFDRNDLSGDFYIPSILGIHEPSSTVLMGSVGDFAMMAESDIQKLKHQMMAAALVLPDYLAQKNICKRTDTVELALIDISKMPNAAVQHFWPLQNIDDLLCVSGAAQAVKDIRNILAHSTFTLLQRMDQKNNAIAECIAPNGQSETIKPTTVRVEFLEFRPSVTG